MEFGAGDGVFLNRGREHVVAEVAAAAGDDYEVSGSELFECFAVGER